MSPLERIGLKDQVETALERFEIQNGQWKTWADVVLTEEVYERVMSDMDFGLKARDEIEQWLPRRRAWAKGTCP